MRKATGPRARWALAGALLAVIANTTYALGMARSFDAVAVGEGQRPALTLGASLDRAPVAPYLELARTTAIAAAAARARLAEAPPAPKHHVHHARAVPANHLWFPSLHINQGIGWYACGRQTALANRVYRWGCGGHNNVYLLGHAWGVFKPLHDAYVNGTLRKGMVAYWSDSRGRVHRFRVTAWQVVKPSVTAWATADQPRLSMTLQTCMGSNSELRLDVRLVSF